MDQRRGEEGKRWEASNPLAMQHKHFAHTCIARPQRQSSITEQLEGRALKKPAGILALSPYLPDFVEVGEAHLPLEHLADKEALRRPLGLMRDGSPRGPGPHKGEVGAEGWGGGWGGGGEDGGEGYQGEQKEDGGKQGSVG